MEVTVHLPDEIAEQFGDVASMPRQLVEAFAAGAYRSERLSRHQVGKLLSLDYWQTEDFLARHDAKRLYKLEDLEIDRATLQKLHGK